MRFLKWLVLGGLLAAAGGGWLYYQLSSTALNARQQLYASETPSQKEIRQTISAAGTLKLKDQIKLGSLVSGRVQAIYVAENDLVTEGQVLVEIDTGLGDTEVREAEGVYEKALAELEYQQAHYRRQSQLFQEHLISEAVWQEAQRHYRIALGEVKALRAAWEKKERIHRHSRVVAPAEGMVLHLEATKGEKVGSDPEGGILLSLAPDIHRMQVELDISEKDIGQIKKDQKVELTVDTYPYKVFETTIHSVGLLAKACQEKGCLYLAKAYIDNPDWLLRPGMNVQATIQVAAAEHTWALSAKPFLIRQEHLQPVADLLGYRLYPIAKQAKSALLNAHPDRHIQFVWVVEEGGFRETPIEIGITDNLYFQVISGLTGAEELVAEVAEKDQMLEIYERFYRKL